MKVQFKSAYDGRLLDRKRYDLSVHRRYATLVIDGEEQYEYAARITLPGIHYSEAVGPTPAAALLALADRLTGADS